MWLGDHNSAVTDFEASRKLGATAKLHYYFGNLRLRERQFSLAVQHYDSCLLADPKCAYAFDERAVANAELARYEEALRDERAAIALDSLNVDYWVNMGYLLYRMNELTTAVQALSTSLTIQPTQRGYSNLGMARFALGQYHEAVEAYSASLRLNPDDSQVRYLRGTAYEELGMWDEACADFTTCSSAGLDVRDRVSRSCQRH